MVYQRDVGAIVGCFRKRGGFFATCLLGLALVACESSKEESPDAGNEKVAPAKSQASEEKVAEPKEPAIPPLSTSALGKVERLSALVRITGLPDRQGVIVNGSMGSTGRSHLVICEAPSDADTVAVAYYPTSRGFGTASAKRISVLPSGLSVYRFTPRESIPTIVLSEPVEGAVFHAIRISEQGEAGPERMAGIDEELKKIDDQVRELRDKRMEMMNDFRMRRGRPGEPMRPNVGQQGGDTMRETFELMRRRAEIETRQVFPGLKIEAKEIAASRDPEGFGSAEELLENTILVSSGSSVHAIRSGGKWVDVKEAVEAASGEIEEVKLDLSGNSQNVSLTCSVKHFLPYGEGSYSLVAASTFELESMGSGSIEERLAVVKPVPFRGSAENLSISRQINWNGQPSNIWVRIFKDSEPGKPVIDEMVHVSHEGNFSARWGKPPSPLIKLPDAPPNHPEDLVTERKKLDAKGRILDLVAAGDGSVVMIRTDAAPYWTPFDLKAGKFLPTTWKATASTLLAAQAGKLYLLDPETKVLEIRNLSSGKREGLQILSYEGTAVAIAAPLENPEKPVMLATDKGAYLFDPVGFDPVVSGMDLEKYFDEEDKRSEYLFLDPATTRVRVSGDGTLYSIQGLYAGKQRSNRLVGETIVLDASSMMVSKYTDTLNIASRGRLRYQAFADHGGSPLGVSPVVTSTRFPGTPGKLQFLGAETGGALVELADLPLVPPLPGKGLGKIADDRACYFDSKAGILLLPDGKDLHVFNLKLPELPEELPPFLMSGESVEIALPPGTDHTLTSSGGGTSRIDGQVFRWTAPVSNQRTSVNLKLEWQGELGSKMNEDFRMDVIPQMGTAEAVSPDGGKRVPLKLRGILPDVRRSLDGFAGSGHVAYSKEHNAVTVYNLATCELLYRREVAVQMVLGDADHLYLVEPRKKITSLDLATGEVLAEKDLVSDIRSIATGPASRFPLMAVEQQGGQGILLMIDPDSLESRIVELNEEARSRFFVPELTSNASGSAMWTRGVAVLRDGKAITVKLLPRGSTHMISSGVPDASGKHIVDRHTVYDITGDTPEATRLPGTETGQMVVGMDVSGRYLMLGSRTGHTGGAQVSVRTIGAPEKELFRISSDAGFMDPVPWMVSGTGTLVCRQRFAGRERHFVYDIDIPSILAELSR